MSDGNTTAIPILLLKTKSSPTDAYEEYFSSTILPASNSTDGLHAGAAISFRPHFVPVLEHRFDDEALERVRQWLISGAFLGAAGSVGGLDAGHGDEGEEERLGYGDGNGRKRNEQYGGLIFTSQRAVEAFTQVVEQLVAENQEGGHRRLLTQTTPLYTVGPATSRALRALAPLLHVPESNILGSETGNGENLAHFILEHYNNLYSGTESAGEERWAKRDKPPLLFLTGEQRRDIIPKTLDSPPSAEGEDQARRRIDLKELVVYATGTMASFETDLTRLLRKECGYPSTPCRTPPQPQKQTQTSTPPPHPNWIVVFSPTGCDTLLHALGLLDPSTGRAFQPDPQNTQSTTSDTRRRQTRIATIGPTTRDYLIKKFGFHPDVCAESPSPEGVGRGIDEFKRRLQPQGVGHR
ncbi:MAG: hypothetical protein M1819_006782 [Sarea resinae]|nr:MAG: hypothetical protein M1819_006782 [Sarea resinae]